MLEQRSVDVLVASEMFLEHGAFMAGQSFTLADIAAVSIAAALSHSIDWVLYPRLRRWFDNVMSRPGVTRGITAFG